MIRSLVSGEHVLEIWLAVLILGGIALTLGRGFLKARKIQPKGFKWATFRNEGLYGALNLVAAGFILAPVTKLLTQHGVIRFNSAPAAWWVIALEYTLYFFLFDTYFYWLHRWMHKEPVYSWVHKVHHKSTSPNLLTTFSVNPLESFINGGFVPLFLSVFTVHDTTVALITPTNIVMGLYVHAGYEFLPRRWHRNWATKWFITTTFHDQHHKYFNYNFGGYTQIWDRLCGTMRKKYEADFEDPKGRQDRKPAIAPAAAPQ